MKRYRWSSLFFARERFVHPFLNVEMVENASEGKRMDHRDESSITFLSPMVMSLNDPNLILMNSLLSPLTTRNASMLSISSE